MVRHTLKAKKVNVKSVYSRLRWKQSHSIQNHLPSIIKFLHFYKVRKADNKNRKLHSHVNKFRLQKEREFTKVKQVDFDFDFS